MMRFWPGRYLKPVAMAPRLAPSLAASVAAHTLLIAAGVAASQHDARTPDELPENSIARFLAPPDRVNAPPVSREVITYVSIGIGSGAIAELSDVAVTQAAEPRAIVLKLDDRVSSSIRAKLDSVFLLVEVDSAAERYEWSAAPAFPPSMLEKGVNGFVRAEWVVNERGLADTTTFRVLEATHPEFGKAVRDALPFMRFRPAKIGPNRVRQLVQQPFTFRVEPVVDTSSFAPAR